MTRLDVHHMTTGYEVCVELRDGTTAPVFIEAENPSQALSRATGDPAVLSAVVVQPWLLSPS
jgi:hypothetical protein